MSDDILHTGRADIHHPKGPLTAQQPLSRGERLRRNHTAQRLGRILASLPEEVYLQLDAGFLEQACAEAAAEVYERAIRAGDAGVRAAALHDFAASMRALAEQAPEGEPVGWPWSAYALAAVKAEEHAARANESGGSVAASDGGANERWVRAAVAEEPVDLETRLFDAEAVLAELVRLKDGPRDAAYERDKPLAWSRARAVLAQIPAAPSVRPDTDLTPGVGTPDPQRYWWQHDGCDSGPVAGAADWPGRPCTGCGMSLGGWTRGAPITAGSVPSLPEETPDAR